MKTTKFSKIWKEVEGYVRCYAHQQCSRDPDDPVSKTMYALWVATEKNKIKDMEHAKAYALRSIKHEVARWWSTQNRRVEVMEQYAEVAPQFSSATADQSTDIDELIEGLAVIQTMVIEAAGNLSLLHKQAMHCKYLGLSHRKTAKLLDIGLPTVGRKLKEGETEALRILADS